MYIQREVYRSGVGMTFNQTHEVDLPEQGELLAAMLYMSSTQNASALVDVKKWRLIDYISKIELIGDGAEPIKSLSGTQALAAAFYNTGQVPSSQWRNYSSVPHRQLIPLHMGRHLNDLRHRLAMNRFGQVKLRITNDATATQLTTSISLTLVLYWLREAQGLPNQGYYREEQWKTWTNVAAAIEYSNLPTKLPIRRIMLEAIPGKTAAFKCEATMNGLLNDIEMTLRSGQSRVYKGSHDVLTRIVHEELGFIPVVQIENYNTGGNAFETGIGYVTGAIGAPGTYAAVAAYVDTYLQDDVNDSAQFCNDRVADAPINVVVRGHSFCHHTPLWWSKEPDDSDLLDVEAVKDVAVDITTQSGITVTNTPKTSIILSRLVR